MATYPLHQKSLMVIFTYAPAGLGHLRVTDALYHGLPTGVEPIILGSQDSFIRLAHRFTSIHPLARSLFEWAQHGFATELFTYIYRLFLRTQTHNIYQQLKTVISQRLEFPQTVVIVATHYAMAQQLGAVKKALMKDLDVRIILVVQVTDDTPQPMWYIQGADVTMVPSERTKERLIIYGKQHNLTPTMFEVNPYPIAPLFTTHLSPPQFNNRLHQLDPIKDLQIHISIPISGAAVGTTYMSTLIEELHLLSNRYLFFVAAKTAPFTDEFLYRMAKHSYATIFTSSHDRILVDEYEQVYKKNIIALEVTKPSEQAFKVLLEPQQRGGVILLFTSPVGRQEYDNLQFMHRHHFIPAPKTLSQLCHCAENNIHLTGELKNHVYSHAKRWRGFMLPPDPAQAAQFITWCLKEGIFTHMMDYNHEVHMLHHAYNPHELSSDGVKLFWQKVSQLL